MASEKKRPQDELLPSGDGRPAGRVPDPEVSEKARRRSYTAEYKLAILEEADACTGPGEIGALLRREGLYSSLLSNWRRQREDGALRALRPRKRGRRAAPVNPLAQRVEELELEKQALQRELEQARAIIDVQKKLSAILAHESERPADATEDAKT